MFFYHFDLIVQVCGHCLGALRWRYIRAEHLIIDVFLLLSVVDLFLVVGHFLFRTYTKVSLGRDQSILEVAPAIKPS